MSNIIDRLRRVDRVVFNDGWESKTLASEAGLKIMELRERVHQLEQEVERLQNFPPPSPQARVTGIDHQPAEGYISAKPEDEAWPGHLSAQKQSSSTLPSEGSTEKVEQAMPSSSSLTLSNALTAMGLPTSPTSSLTPIADLKAAFPGDDGIGASFNRDLDAWVLYTTPKCDRFGQIDGYDPKRIEAVLAVMRSAFARPSPQTNVVADYEQREAICTDAAMSQWSRSRKRPDLDEEARVRGAIEAYKRQAFAFSHLPPAPENRALGGVE